MTPRRNTDDEALGRTLRVFGPKAIAWLKAHALPIAIAYAAGGGSSTLIDKFSPDKPSPQMDSVMAAVRQIPPLRLAVDSHSVELRKIDVRLVSLEPDKVDYEPRRPRGVGRWRER